jgi:hypothetical protein
MIVSPDAMTRQVFSKYEQPGWIRASRGVLAFCVLFEELDGVANGQDRLGGIVRNLAAELLLERHDELDRIEAVGTEVVDEAGFSVTLSASTPRCSTTIFFTRSPMSLIAATSWSLNWARSVSAPEPLR